MLGKKCKLVILVMGFFFLGLQKNIALAAVQTKSDDQSTSDDQFFKKLVRRTQVLESQLRHLKSQVTYLQRQQSRKTQVTKVTASSTEIDIVADPNRPVFIIGTPVISSPYIGINSEYNASDLVVNQPYINEDLYLLQQRRQLRNYLYKQNKFPEMNTPIVNLSGKIEAQIIHGNQFGNLRRSMTDIDLTGIELDTEVLVNSWVTGLIAFMYDNGPPHTSPRRIDNSRLALERGFLTIGKLDRLPLYSTIGQFYVPFGQYSSAMISNAFTKTLGRTKARAIALGFSTQLNSENNLNLAAFVFRGPSKTSDGNRGLHNYGGNVSYTFSKQKWNLNLAASYIRNITDSVGMQHNGNIDASNGFSGFATNEQTEILNPVAGIDTRGTLSVEPVSLVVEYVTAASPFSVSTLSFGTQNNLRGAKPEAFHTELAYKFSAWKKPSGLAVSYDQSKDALALLIPKKRYSMTASTSIWKDTIESIEFRHDVDYSATDVSVGQRLTPIIGTGQSANTVTFQIGLYF